MWESSLKHSCEERSLDLFSKSHKSTSIEDVSVTHVRPSTNFDGPSNNLIFEVFFQDRLIDFQKSFIFFQLAICDSSNVPLSDDPTTGDECFPTSHIASLFESLNLSLNGTTILSNNLDFKLYNHFLTRLGYNDDDLKSILYPVQYYKPGAESSIKTLFKTGKVYNAILPLNIALGLQERLLLNQVPLQITLIRSKPPVTLKTDEDTIVSKKPYVRIVNSLLHVYSVKVDERKRNFIERQLMSQPSLYYFPRFETKNFIIGKTQLDFKTVISRGLLPKRLFFILLKHDAYVGDYKQDLFTYHGHDFISMINLSVNGKSLENGGINFTSGTSAIDHEAFKIYLILLKAIGKNNLTFGDFQSKPIFGYDIHPTSKSMCNNMHLSKEYGELFIEFDFLKKLDEVCNLCCLLEYDQELSIDVNREITTL